MPQEQVKEAKVRYLRVTFTLEYRRSNQGDDNIGAQALDHALPRRLVEELDYDGVFVGQKMDVHVLEEDFNSCSV